MNMNKHKNDDKHQLEKSYKLLILWLVSLFIFAGLFNTLLTRIGFQLSSKMTTIFWLYFTNLYFISILGMIYKTERVYYINYITYKEARDATGEERRAFAYKHLRVFIVAAIAFLFYSIPSLILQFPRGLDIGVFMGIMIVVAIRTVPFKLKENSQRIQ
ncbi:hypothetical protein [Isachenkonia alkalipeptolytica]|uniref:Uncharacterized protein n=1 Tax=Isachenkonia alkalipeptolytica TaxID=2565777 RepID=A0AA44BDS4_9CLOT|nr:hypothetical protein [Isachenkonia alkalipeptolytica]NBG88228.1 hypothetical protein [Isachenkonia alkalipeptolytica]